MNESGAGSRRFTNAVTVVVCAAAVAIPYWADRAFRRWWTAKRPLAPFGTRMRRMRTQYRTRQDSIEDGAEFVTALADVMAGRF